MPTFNLFRTPDPPKQRQPTSDQATYRSTSWRKVRRMQIATFPYCQAHWQKGELIDCTFDSPVDHVIPIDHGGAKYDERNLLTLCPSCHNRKSALEKHYGVLVASQESESGLIPAEDLAGLLKKIVQ